MCIAGKKRIFDLSTVEWLIDRRYQTAKRWGREKASLRDGEVLSQKELSSYFEELFSSKVPHQKELSSSNEELFPNPALHQGFSWRKHDYLYCLLTICTRQLLRCAVPQRHPRWRRRRHERRRSRVLLGRRDVLRLGGNSIALNSFGCFFGDFLGHFWTPIDPGSIFFEAFYWGILLKLVDSWVMFWADFGVIF